jgi:hypothetical protein
MLRKSVISKNNRSDRKMKYHLLGKLPKETIDLFLVEIIKRKTSNDPYQWIQFDDYLHNEFLKIFTNTELKIQWSVDKKRYIQKAFYSEPGHGYTIHKDGFKCQSALNISISCNPDDWVRWYDEDYINSISTVKYLNSNKTGLSRDTSIKEYENINFAKELHNEVGDVYIVDVDTYHSFKCLGNKPRIVIQTKFENFPNFETVKESLMKNSFSNLINC